ncbi:MAG TPA: hypothetical protein VFA04_27350 [Bryobacteraceae bacterium]|nr:hypothetical protein [Bryobacteraceae bacterium]
MDIHSALLYIVLAIALVAIAWLSRNEGDHWESPERRHRGW